MGAAIGTSVAVSPVPTSQGRARSAELDGATITMGTAPPPRGTYLQRHMSGWVGGLLASSKFRLRSGGRTPLLVGAAIVVALLALCGALIAWPTTNSDRRPAVSNSPTTAPATTSPATAPIVAASTTAPATTSPATAPTTAAPATAQTTAAPTTAPATTSPATAPDAAASTTAPATTSDATAPTPRLPQRRQRHHLTQRRRLQRLPQRRWRHHLTQRRR